MVEKNIQNILEYWKANPDVDVNAEEAVRMFIDANDELKTCTPEQKQQLLKSVEDYYNEVKNKLTTKNLGVTENTPLFQLFAELVKVIKAENESIDSETRDYLRTLASASLNIYQNDRSRRLGDTSIQRLHANDTEVSFLNELKEKVLKKNLNSELLKITEFLFSQISVANRFDEIVNLDSSMDYTEAFKLISDIYRSHLQKNDNTRRLLKDRVINLNRYLAEHQDVDINAKEITEILLDSAKVIQKNQTHESEDTVEIINGVIELSQTAVNRLLSTDLQLEKNSTLCQLILQLTGNAVLGIPAVEEKEEEYIKNLAKISLSTRQEDRSNRITLDNNHKIYDNEGEYQTIKEQREIYKQNNQKGIYATITDCLFAEITKAKTENKIYSFSLPFSLPELKKVEVENKEADRTQELIKRIQGVNQYLIDNPDNNVNMVELAGLYIDATKEENKEELNTTIHTLSDTVQKRMKKKNRIDTPLNILMNKLSNSALNHEEIVSPLEEEYLKELISANAFIYEQQERRENGEELRLFDNKEQLQTLNSKQYTVRFKEPNIQTLAKELLEEVQTAYQEDKLVVEAPKLEEEPEEYSKEAVKKLKQELKAETSFLKEHPEQNIDVKVTAGLLIESAKAKKTDVGLNVRLNQMWSRTFSRLIDHDLEETALANTLTHLYKSARSKTPAVVSTQEKEYLTDLLEVNFKIQERAKKSEEGQNLRLYDNEKEFNDLEKTHQEVKFNQPMTQSLADRLFKEIENAYTKVSSKKADDVEPKEKIEQPKVEESKPIDQEKISMLTKKFNGVKDFLKGNPEADINAVELADLFIEASSTKQEDTKEELQNAIEELWQVAYSRIEKMKIEETAVAKTLINLAKSAIQHQSIVKPEEENFLKDIVRINFYIQQQQKKRENGETIRLFDNESEYNQIVAQSQNIHFSNPEIGTQAEQLVNEIKLAYQTDQIKPKQGVQNQPDNVSDLSIQEMAIQIYNQRKIMQAIASECQTLEEYLARIGEEVTIMPSNDEIEAEVVKIKK